ncbi:MAG: YdcF family protein [Angustibacter sp.]
MTTRAPAALRAVRTVVVGLVVLLAVVLVLTAATVVQHGRSDDARQADAIVVLGAAQFDGRPQEYLVARLQHAQELFDSGTAPRIVTLGGKQPGDRFTEGQAGRQWLLDHGVPASAVVAVGEGNDTLESVRAAAAVFDRNGWTSAVVVTDPWHELRSTTMFSDAGVTAYGSPTPTGPSVDGTAVKVRYVARETVAVVAYEVSQWIS